MAQLHVSFGTPRVDQETIYQDKSPLVFDDISANGMNSARSGYSFITTMADPDFKVQHLCPSKDKHKRMEERRPHLQMLEDFLGNQFADQSAKSEEDLSDDYSSE